MSSAGTSTALATVGTVCWCIQLIPQVIRNWYVRDCEGVPPIMFFLFGTSGIPFAVYFVDQFAQTAFIVQPHLFSFFSFCAFWQSLYYPPVSYSWQKASIILAVTVAICAGIEAGCIVPLRDLYAKGITWPNLIPGIVASVLLAAGLLPPYWELMKRKGQVVGINFVFLFLDSTGALMSMCGVAVNPGETDILGLVLYIIVFAMEYGIILSHVGWMVMVRMKKISTEPDSQAEEWEAIKRERSSPPRSQPLRDWVTHNIVMPVNKSIERFTSKHTPAENSDALSSICSQGSQPKQGKTTTANITEDVLSREQDETDLSATELKGVDASTPGLRATGTSEKFVRGPEP